MADIQRGDTDRDLERALQGITAWAKRGTLRQFYNEMSARLAEDEEYRVDIRSDTVVFLRVRKEGGILGIGARTVEEPLLQVRKDGGQVIIPEDPLDKEFARKLAAMLGRH
jgi:hypothetical protein